MEQTEPKHYVILQPGLSDSVIDALTAQYGEENIIPASIAKFVDKEEFTEGFPFNRDEFEKNKEKFKGNIITIVQSTGEPCSENLFYAKLAADVAKRAGAKIVNGVFPYQAWMRQEKDELEIGRFSSMANPMIAKELKAAGFDHVTLFTPHSEEGINQYKQVFGNNFAYVNATKVFIDQIKKQFPNLDDIVIGAPDGLDKPDDQGQKRAEDIAKALFGDDYKNHMFGIQKKRRGPGKSEIVRFEGNVKGKTAIVVDDMISTGGTMVHAAEELKKQGADKVVIASIHGILANGLPELLRHRDANDNFFIDNIMISNTLPVEQKIRAGKFELPGILKRVQVMDISSYIIQAIEEVKQKTNQMPEPYRIVKAAPCHY